LVFGMSSETIASDRFGYVVFKLNKVTLS